MDMWRQLVEHHVTKSDDAMLVVAIVVAAPPCEPRRYHFVFPVLKLGGARLLSISPEGEKARVRVLQEWVDGERQKKSKGGRQRLFQNG